MSSFFFIAEYGVAVDKETTRKKWTDSLNTMNLKKNLNWFPYSNVHFVGSSINRIFGLYITATHNELDSKFV